MNKILLIDDEKILNESLSDVIQALGYQVENYLSIHEAIRQVDLRTIDMIICDVGLPGECAFTFIQWVRKNYQRLPFVLLSAFSEEDAIRKGLEAGADRYVVKPVRLNQLRELLSQSQSVL